MSLFIFSSREELKGASSSSLNKNTVTCALCSCNERLPWFRDQFKSYGPISKIAESPSANEIFRPYLESDTLSTRSGSQSSPEGKDGFVPSSEANSLPMHIGYFFRSNIQSVIDCEDMIRAHRSCIEWSVCTQKKDPESVLLIVASALTQVRCFFVVF